MSVKWVCATLAIALVTATCAKSTPTAPSAPPAPPPPPVVVNTPPSIVQVRAVDRVENGQDIELTAFVSDAETPLDQLAYVWTSDPPDGTFVGAGPQVHWRAPNGAQTPNLYTFTITVTENYTSAGQPKQNVVSAGTYVHYNDNNKEIGAISMQFLTDFSTFAVSPADCVRNFSDFCPGKAAEQGQITDNRRDYQILGGDFSISNIALNSDHSFARVTMPCTFYDIPNGHSRERVDGICTLTATYVDFKWFLCDSFFQGLGVTKFSQMGRAMESPADPLRALPPMR